MFHTRKKSAVAMASLVVATALLTGCRHHHAHHHTPKPVAPVVAPPVKENQISWLILALVPGVLLLVLLIGIHIGAKGVQDALTTRGRP